MIGIFSGRGIADTARVHAQIDVDFRDHVYQFNNGHNLNSLAVFLCIALHADDNGWAFPGRELLKKETGIKSDGAISNAIKHLRKVEIGGYPVLSHYRLKDRQNKRWDRSLYLIFPSLPHGGAPSEIIDGCDMFLIQDDEPVKIDPPPVDPGVGQPGVDDPGLGEVGYKKNQCKQSHEEEKPSGVITPHQEMFGRLARLCQIDLDLITKTDRGKLNKVSKKLIEAGKVPAHLDDFEHYWYSADWRGQKGQPPNPYDVTKEWERAKRWLSGGNDAKDANGPTQTYRQRGRTRPYDRKELGWRQRARELKREGRLD